MWFGNILLYFGLEGFKNHKIKKMFIVLPTIDKSTIKSVDACNYAQCFTKKVNANKMKL